jgi:hypothetical protein
MAIAGMSRRQWKICFPVKFVMERNTAPVVTNISERALQRFAPVPRGSESVAGGSYLRPGAHVDCLHAETIQPAGKDFIGTVK